VSRQGPATSSKRYLSVPASSSVEQKYDGVAAAYLPCRTLPVERHSFAAIKAPIFLGSPSLLVAPFLKVCLGALGKEQPPRGLAWTD
jgi:hypothetical protein